MQPHRAGAPSAPRETPLFPHHKAIHPLHHEENERKPLEVPPGAPGYCPRKRVMTTIISGERAHHSAAYAHFASFSVPRGPVGAVSSRNGGGLCEGELCLGLGDGIRVLA